MASPLRGSRLALGLAALLAAAAPARAQSTAAEASGLEKDAVLAGLIRDSLAAQPELSRVAAGVRAEQARAAQLGTMPDPMLQVGIQNDGFRSIEVGNNEMSFISVMASQTFPWPGKLALRRQVGELSAQQTQIARERVELSTRAEVRRAYLDLVLARDRLTVLDQLANAWQKVAAAATARYETSQASQTDALRAELERSRLELNRRSLELEAVSAEQRLNQLRHHPLGERIATDAHLESWPLPNPEPASQVERLLAKSPELRATRMGAAAADKASELARTTSAPDFTLSAGIMYRGTTLPPMWQLNVAAPLPIFSSSKERESTREAAARRAMVQQSSEGLERLLRLRIEQRRAALTVLGERLRIYRERVLAQSAATVDSATAAYVVGQLPLSAVIEAHAGYLADRDGFLVARAEAERIRIADEELSLDAIDRAAPVMTLTAPASAGGESAM